MRKVIERIIDKNGGVKDIFNPTARMILFAVQCAKNPTLTPKEVLEKIGFDPESHARWQRTYHSFYIEWLEEMKDQYMDENKADALEAVGMINALQGNFNFWKEMAKTHGVIKEESKELRVTINTDFSRFKGMDFEESRRAILESTRGVEYPRRHRLAEGTGVGEHKGSGARTIEVQGRSVEMDDSLGKDGGREEQGQAVPAVSRRPAPVRSN